MLASILAAWLEPRGDTSSSDKAALSEFEQSSGSALPDRAFVTAVFSQGEGLDWCITVKVGVTVVGDFLFNDFTRDELLSERLAGCAVLGSAAPTACFNSSLISILVVKSRMDTSIFECVVETTEV